MSELFGLLEGAAVLFVFMTVFWFFTYFGEK